MVRNCRNQYQEVLTVFCTVFCSGVITCSIAWYWFICRLLRISNMCFDSLTFERNTKLRLRRLGLHSVYLEQLSRCLSLCECVLFILFGVCVCVWVCPHGWAERFVDDGAYGQRNADICQCMHAYVDTYLPTYLRTYLPTYSPTYVLPACLPTYVHT